MTITSNTNFNNISSNTNLLNNLNSTMTTNFNNISSNTNLINTNINNISSNTNLINTSIDNISSNTHLIDNLHSTMTTNFNNISSNSSLITGLNSTINSHIIAISDLQNGGSLDGNLYYNEITTNNLLLEKLDTSILNNTLIHNIPTTATFKIAEFGNYNYNHQLYNIDTYVYGSLTGATMILNQRGFGDFKMIK